MHIFKVDVVLYNILAYNLLQVIVQCIAGVPIRSVLCPYFHLSGLNAVIYIVNLQIQSKSGKRRSRKSLYLKTWWWWCLF